MNYHTVDTNIKQIKPGDTVLHNGHLKTVCRNNIKNSDFMGRSLWGDSYNSGHKPVKKVIFTTKGK